jgi:hypothetical protein
MRGAIALAILVCTGCQGVDQQAQPLAALDEPYFRCHVQPVLTKSCAAFACHGDARRYFHVFARNRLRLMAWGDPLAQEQARNVALTADERAANFDAARGFVDARSPDASYLLLKPLEGAAGGYYHRGALIFGQGNVFATREDPDFVVFSKWVHGQQEDPSCVEPGSTN